MTPPEVFALRPGTDAPDTVGWQVRVVPNKFPAFVPDASVPKPTDPLHPILAGTGLHEVIIHGPDHEKSFGQLQVEDLARVFSVYQERLRAIATSTALASAIIIVNHGVEAGASISHPHSQLFAIPVVPPLLKQELDRFREHFDEQGTCLLCDLAESEEREQERLVAQDDDFIAFCPYASRVPFETYVVPKRHAADFAEADERTLTAAAKMMHLVLERMHARLGDVPYNIYLHSRPFHSNEPYHWHFAILPKTSIIAGFEYGSGIMINVVEPETAAEFLRDSGE